MFNFLKPVEHISAEELNKMISQNDDLVLIDVRSPLERQSDGYIKESILEPLRKYENSDFESYKNKVIIFYCRSGNRSAHACRILNSQGFKTKNLSGGVLRWKELGYKLN
ncbi:MAG: rhodanese-like domain-containing protein [Spirochaetota bacterium]|nr:rhodanese-like domain-containing protein [Spirochaetota bacterium]